MCGGGGRTGASPGGRLWRGGVRGSERQHPTNIPPVWHTICPALLLLRGVLLGNVWVSGGGDEGGVREYGSVCAGLRESECGYEEACVGGSKDHEGLEL